MPRAGNRARARAGGTGSSRQARRRQGPTRPAGGSQEDLTGQIMWLPSPADMDLTCHATPLGLDEGCYNHPVLVLSSCPSKKEVEILIVTSFHSTSLSKKHRRNAALRKLYLPIHPAPTHPDLKGTLLHLEGNKELLRKSYVNLRKRWNVPLHVLKGYPHGCQVGRKTYKLTKDSMTIISGFIAKSSAEDVGRDVKDDEDGEDVVASSSCIGAVGRAQPSRNVESAMACRTPVWTTSAILPPPPPPHCGGSLTAHSHVKPPTPAHVPAPVSASLFQETSSARPFIPTAVPVSRTASSPYPLIAAANKPPEWTSTYGSAAPHTPLGQQHSLQGPHRQFVQSLPGAYPSGLPAPRTRRQVNGYYYHPSPQSSHATTGSPEGPRRGSTLLDFLIFASLFVMFAGCLILLFYTVELAWTYLRGLISHVVHFVVSSWSHFGHLLARAKEKVVEFGLKVLEWFMHVGKGAGGL
ncbi:hypothetical protein QBC44DRAFT_396965 [Cladorrhinum sp. PSN332]|nr:hypothetical protein QBC44DRAFT_396965 [Cladorrhinum sp. PSN332]